MQWTEKVKTLHGHDEFSRNGPVIWKLFNATRQRLTVKTKELLLYITAIEFLLVLKFHMILVEFDHGLAAPVGWTRSYKFN